MAYIHGHVKIGTLTDSYNIYSKQRTLSYQRQEDGMTESLVAETSKHTSTTNVHLDTISENYHDRLNLEGVGRLMDDWLQLVAPL